MCVCASAEDIDLYDQDQGKPTELHYVLRVAFSDGHLSQKSLELVNGGLKSDTNPDADSDTACEELGLDRVNSEYSDGVPCTLCRYSASETDENTQEYSVCEEKRSYTRDSAYYCEVQDSTGGFLESFDFTFTIPTKCYECETDESESRDRCFAADKFDFTLTIPFHEDASALKFFAKQKDGTKKQIASVGLGKFKDAVKKRSYDDAAL